ncbi:MAG: AMP-binding protein [Elusimicrobia bacterium]|nr:AMP-binding protein [Elusimicrobiota bacterium]
MAEAGSVNIACRLSRMAARRPDAAALVFPRGGASRRLSFRELDDDSDRCARGLERLGVRRGTRTVLMVRPGPDFFALTFALFKLGAVPVLVDPGLGLRGLGRCLSEAEPEAFIAVPLAHAARALLGWARATLTLRIVAGPRFLPGLTTLAEVRRLGEGGRYEAAPTLPEDTAAILFTSGSTGSPKGAVYSHGNFAAQVELLGRHFGIEPGEVDLPTFPLFALFDPALGMTAVIPEMDFTRPGSVEPRRILDPIREHGVTHMFGSPALLDRVGRYGAERGVRLPSLKRVVSAGAPVPPKVIERFTRLLPEGVQIHTPYGATEALPVSSIAGGEVLAETRAATAKGKGVCVGRPLPGVEVRVIRISEEPIAAWSPALLAPHGEVGELVVRGPQVTRSYYGRPDADRLAKIALPGGEVAHRLGDLGYFDEEGRIWFCGRKSHRVSTPRGLLFTIPCEGVFNAHPAVRRSALVGVGAAPAQRPVLVVELERGFRPGPALRAELLELGAGQPHTRCIADILFHPALPVDIRHNAKIFREKLAVWAAPRLRS